MNSVNKTLYIPLYGKAMVSAKGIILSDQTAERIWEQNKFPLKRKSRSKWLAYFMAMRAKVFDEWTSSNLKAMPNATVLHIGCGLDSRVERIDGFKHTWYDIDFDDVITERKKYFSDCDGYSMLCGDAKNPLWLNEVNGDNAIVILEGISMYLKLDDLQNLFASLQARFKSVKILMDIYTPFGAKMTKVKNPVNDVGVTEVYGIAKPTLPTEKCNIHFINEREMTPKALVNQLKGWERFFFRMMFAGGFAKRIYRLYEYET